MVSNSTTGAKLIKMFLPIIILSCNAALVKREGDSKTIYKNGIFPQRDIPFLKGGRKICYLRIIPIREAFYRLREQ